jgi:putative OPT family oligopeptide transporter
MEISIRGTILGIILAAILAMSTTFLGLKIARTISGSIPAALISMMILRWFRNSSIFENNMVQTIASAGETTASSVIFTIPALLIMGYWQNFDYITIAIITAVGSILGIMISIPLRRIMVNNPRLNFPESIAIAAILKSGDASDCSTKLLLRGGFIGSVISLMQTALQIVSEGTNYMIRIGSSAINIGINFSPILIGAGYITGFKNTLHIMLGSITNAVGLAIFIYFYDIQLGDEPLAILSGVQKMKIRYVAIGLMIFAGIYGIFELSKYFKDVNKNNTTSNCDTTDDIPNRISIPMVVASIFGICGIAYYFLSDMMSGGVLIITSIVITSVVVCVSIFSASLAAHIVGTTGTTALPVSAICISAIIIIATTLLISFTLGVDNGINSSSAMSIAGLVIILTCVVALAAALSGDNMQDLKAGQIIGATPWKQQVMLVIGSIAASFVIPYVLQSSYEAYGIADVLPRADMNPNNSLLALQATLMATVTKGFFANELPLDMIVSENKRVSVINFALGMYLPMGYSLAFFIGGAINLLVNRSDNSGCQNGILLASGIICGEAILGALLTVPFGYWQSTEIFAIKVPALMEHANTLGYLCVLYLVWQIYKSTYGSATSAKNESS